MPCPIPFRPPTIDNDVIYDTIGTGFLVIKFGEFRLGRTVNQRTIQQYQHSRAIKMGISKPGAKKDRSIHERAVECLEAAKVVAAENPSWQDAWNRLYGIGGLFGKLFNSKEERGEFLKTPECEEIRSTLSKLPGAYGSTEEASGRFVLRLPKSLHAALQIESAAEGVSLNQLILAKIAVSLGSKLTGG